MTILSDVPATSEPNTATMGENTGNSADTKPKFVKVRNENGIEVFFKMYRQDPFHKLMHAYCNRMGLCKHSVHFRFAGERISEVDTMATMGMENGDRIDVYQK